jgi:predicted SPOUT superfamily RNA methylase MTH1
MSSIATWIVAICISVLRECDAKNAATNTCSPIHANAAIFALHVINSG